MEARVLQTMQQFLCPFLEVENIVYALWVDDWENGEFQMAPIPRVVLEIRKPLSASLLR